LFELWELFEMLHEPRDEIVERFYLLLEEALLAEEERVEGAFAYFAVMEHLLGGLEAEP
jgi:hypothetical protein